ncbi:hypothetical protein D6745_05030 [Candidatus Woesearchaeota archaeon]|nr:MAG: hypothetical protein D6745_05030 [Candidatus Woesearchaeota archaeon]
MVLCLVALPVFAVLSIFSVKYRKLTKEAFDCLFKTVTFRKCRSGLDNRIRAVLTGRIIRLSPGIAKIFYKNYKIFSWVLFILLVWSFYVSFIGIHNYILYGNCNGPESSGFCIFDPTGSNSRISEIDYVIPANITYPVLEDDDPIIGDPKAELTIIEFGCYTCPYTKNAESTVQKIIDYYNGRVNVQFKTFVIPNHPFSTESALAADCALEQGKYYDYHKLLFDNQEKMNYDMLISLAGSLGMNMTQFTNCLEDEKYKFEVQDDTFMGLEAGVPGTPTFFIGKSKVVGPKPFKTFKNIIDEELKK